MCMVLYAAADAPLRTIPDDGPVALSVRPINATEELVRAHFSKPHVYFLGSHSACSCGFNYGYSPNTDAAGRESVTQLGLYLAAAVTHAGPIEIYACWDGDEAKHAKEHVTVTTDHFRGDAEEFQLSERWFAVVAALAS
jgi:hypothetical protein